LIWVQISWLFVQPVVAHGMGEIGYHTFPRGV